MLSIGVYYMKKCKHCNLYSDEPDAIYCKACGGSLEDIEHTEDETKLINNNNLSDFNKPKDKLLLFYKKNKKILITASIGICLLIVLMAVLIPLLSNLGKEQKYEDATEHINKGFYTKGVKILEDIDPYKDSTTILLYAKAKLLYCSAEKNYTEIEVLLNDIPDNYEGDMANSIKNFKSQYTISKKDALIQEERKKQAEIASTFWKEHESSPIEISSYGVSYNLINTPEFYVEAKNVSEKTIDAFDIQFFCYDNFNNPVNNTFKNTNVCYGTHQKIISPGDSVNSSTVWTGTLFSNTTKITAIITNVHFTDNTTWAMSSSSTAYANQYFDENISDFWE